MTIHPRHHTRRRARAAARREAQTPMIRLDEAVRNMMNAFLPPRISPSRINCSPEIAAQLSNFGMTREAIDIRLSQALALEAGAVPNELVNLVIRTSSAGRVAADDLDRLKGWGGAGQ